MTFLVTVCAGSMDWSHGRHVVVDATAFVPQTMQGNGTLVVQPTTQHQGTVVGHRDVLNALLMKPPNFMQGQQGQGVPNVHGGPLVVDVPRTHDGALFARGQSFDFVVVQFEKTLGFVGSYILNDHDFAGAVDDFGAAVDVMDVGMGPGTVGHPVDVFQSKRMSAKQEALPTKEQPTSQVSKKMSPLSKQLSKHVLFHFSGHSLWVFRQMQGLLRGGHFHGVFLLRVKTTRLFFFLFQRQPNGFQPSFVGTGRQTSVVHD